MMEQPSTEDLCGCLRRIAALLEEGAPVEAATVMAEMIELLPRLSPEMPKAQLDGARLLLAHCGVLERALRQNVLESLQRLAATKKSMVYRGYGNGP